MIKEEQPKVLVVDSSQYELEDTPGGLPTEGSKHLMELSSILSSKQEKKQGKTKGSKKIATSVTRNETPEINKQEDIEKGLPGGLPPRCNKPQEDNSNKLEEYKKLIQDGPDVVIDGFKVKDKVLSGEYPNVQREGAGNPLFAGSSPASPDTLTEESREINTSEQSRKILDILNIRSPFDFLCLFDDEINSGRVTLYPWQQKFLEEFAEKDWTKDDPYEGAKVCCNGSGKDKYIIAPIAAWMICCHEKARVIITTASGNQLNTQTEPYIRQLCQKVNSFLGKEYVVIKQRHIIVPQYNEIVGKWEDGSEVCLFATDEGYKAEGYHPWEAGRKLVLILNEAKGVLPEIFEAFERCNGYTHKLMVSSPGKDSGNFYNYYLSGIPKADKITAYQCPHISQASIDKTEKLYGKDSALFRSMVLAEFTNVDGMTVVGDDDYGNCLNYTGFIHLYKETFSAGLDSAKGGDETVLSVWNGNKQVAIEAFLCKDITVEADILVQLFVKWHLKGPDVNSDDGGIGGGLNDILHRKGYYVIRVLNQSVARDSAAFQNRGAELYFNFNRLIQEKLILPLPDQKQRSQITSRKYKQSEALGKMCLQSKKEARAEGQHSPDRGDACVLNFAGKNIYDYINDRSKAKPNHRETVATVLSSYGDKAAKGKAKVHMIVDSRFTDPFAEQDTIYKKRTGGRVFGNIMRILKG